MSDAKKSRSTVKTTGHVWDGDLEEYNNPLPTWWLWSFYATVVFAVVYWIFYPAWPIGGGYTTGIMNEITYVDSDGTEKTTSWNTRALLLKDLQEGKSATLSREYLEKVRDADYQTILADAEMMAFTRSMAVGLFGDNCTPCHGAGGAGVMGLFPTLADDDWLWGGTVEEIETTIADGRYGFMPAFSETFTDRQLDDLASYVLSLSGQDVEAAAVMRGKNIFQTREGGCYYCHGVDGKGMKSQGSANLTDQIWTVADVQGAGTTEQKKAVVKTVITDGVQRTMPHWSDRLDDTQIKLLTVYVHELGGGQ